MLPRQSLLGTAEEFFTERLALGKGIKASLCYYSDPEYMKESEHKKEKARTPITKESFKESSFLYTQ